MNADLLFEAMGGIDDRFIEEAAEETMPHRGWKIAAVAAAAAAVVVGSVWFSSGLFRPDAPAPQDLSAPVISQTPALPFETAQPAPGGTDSGAATPGDTAQSPATLPAEQTPSQPNTQPVPDSGSGASGSWPPNLGFGIPGFGFQGSDPPGSGNGSSGGLSPNLPGSGLALPGLPSLPGMGGASVPYRVEYRHSDAGDYLVLHSPVLGVPVAALDITGQIVDGYYAGSFHLLGQTIYVELRVYEDGSYELSY